MTLAYLDSSIIIHATDQTDDGQRVRERIAAAGATDFLISPLVRMESLVRPVRANDTEWIKEREELLDQFVESPIERRAFDLATHMRARHMISTADAIHIATASLNDCDEVWTTDKQLVRSIPRFAVDVLAPDS
jgi:predicted nucleic acid-binding protein